MHTFSQFFTNIRKKLKLYHIVYLISNFHYSNLHFCRSPDMSLDLDQWTHRVVTGQQMNELLGQIPVLKFMRNNDLHYGMQYVTGDNLDIMSFRGYGECRNGGLYVTTILDYIDHYSEYGDYARRVRINPNALVYVETGKFKCDEIFLEEKMPKVLIDKIFN